MILNWWIAKNAGKDPVSGCVIRSRSLSGLRTSTSMGSFSSVWAATIARVGSFFSILRDLKICLPLHRSKSRKFERIFKHFFANFRVKIFGKNVIFEWNFAVVLIWWKNVRISPNFNSCCIWSRIEILKWFESWTLAKFRTLKNFRLWLCPSRPNIRLSQTFALSRL